MYRLSVNKSSAFETINSNKSVLKYIQANQLHISTIWHTKLCFSISYIMGLGVYIYQIRPYVHSCYAC